jgi:predicted histone-like DNA-binding protein
MANYEMRVMPDLHGTGQEVIYPRMIVERRISTDELAAEIAYGSTFTAGELKGIISGVAERMAAYMGNGCSIKLDGIGTFSAKLGLKADAERESPLPNAPHLNARSITVSGIQFQADKQLISGTKGHCTLERTTRHAQRSSTLYTADERLIRALAYLETHPVLSVRAYAEMNGLRHSTAALELRNLSAQETSPLRHIGQASHRLYLKRENEEI